MVHLEQHEQALVMFDRAIELSIKNFEQVWSNRGAVLIKLLRFKEAATSCDRAIAMNSADPLPWYMRGLALAHLGRDDEALSSCDSAIEVEPHYSPAWSLRGLVLYRLGRAHEAARCYDEIIKLNLEDSMAWSYRGAALARLGDLEEALVSFDRAVGLGAQPAFVALSRAQILIALGRWDEAIEALGNALKRTDLADGAVAGAASVIVGDLFTRISDFNSWRSRVSALLDVYGQDNRINALGVGLVTTLPAVRSSRRDDEAMCVWRDLWSELGNNQPELELPLRFLDVAVRYRQTEDERVLLELAAEERKLVTPMICDNARTTAQEPTEEHG